MIDSGDVTIKFPGNESYSFRNYDSNGFERDAMSETLNLNFTNHEVSLKFN